ncbi:Glucanosyltransferase, partial [Mycena sanguinolenta]
DQLADAAGCVRDFPFLQQLGVNAIRAYRVDSTLNHDSCMSALSGAGIYVMCVLSSFHNAFFCLIIVYSF